MIFQKMRKSILLIIILVANLAIAYSQDNDTVITKKLLIYKFSIRKEIAPPVWHTTKKALEEAVQKQADIILIEMSTYGGMLESADSIRTKILDCPIPVFVFINHNAASAGALIAIACDSIYMTPGSSIGAATVVDQAGQVVPEKYQSYMRAMMRSTAEASGRDPNIAEAMVDPRIKIEGVIDSGKVLTFTASEALKFGYCEGIAESPEEVIKLAGIQDYEIIEQEIKPMDKIISFLINPVVSGILIMVIIGGIYFELQAPGLGFASVIAILAALMYFAPLYLEGLASHWEILIFIVGIILIILEIFAIPGFGVTGISGIVLVVLGLTLSLVDNVGFDFSYVNFYKIISSFFLVIISMLISIVASFFITKSLFTQNRLFGSLALETVQSSAEGFTAADNEYLQMIGKTGVAHTILRPAGKVKIGDNVYDATALTGYIEQGDVIEVVRYEGAQLFVRKFEI
jgi:membrane-bound serine protease (ClpP class)